MQEVTEIYLKFLENFPETLRPIVSIGLAVLLVFSVLKVLKKDWIYIVVLVLLLPGSKTILLNIWDGLVSLVKFLLNAK